ncbi:MADS-box transcription factor 47 [Platanthera zijinensis]|uniref:MADS-box transcription factor 47 n=1 Tax=Platanthera zijinensis TaxID=2320716 RepID=A0AAP0FXL2_9ASPA
MHFENLKAAKQPSLDLQLENGSFKMLSKQVAEVTRQLRNMRGEDLHGLTIEDLQNLEKTLETGLSQVIKRKGELIIWQINELLKKRCELTEENTRLRYQVVEISRLEKQQVIADRGNAFQEDRESSESATILTHFGNPAKNNDSSGASLKLGLSCAGWK